MGADPTFIVSGWRFRPDPVTSGESQAYPTNPAQNTAWTAAIDDIWTLRFLVENNNNRASTNETWQLEFRRSTGGGAFGSWTPVNGTSNYIRSASGSNLADGVDTTENGVSGATQGGSWTTPNDGQDDTNGNAGGNDCDIDKYNYTHFEFAFTLHSGSGTVEGDVFEFRILNDNAFTVTQANPAPTLYAPQTATAPVPETSAKAVAATATAPLTAQANVAKSSATPVAATSVNSPVYWDMEENSSPITDENNSITATANDTATFVAAKTGLGNYAISVTPDAGSFSASDHIALRPSSAFTACCWVNPQGTPQSYARFFSKHLSGVYSYGIGHNSTTWNVAAFFRVNSTNYGTPNSTNPLDTNKWYFLVAYWKSGEKLFLSIYNEDGSLVETLESATTITGTIDYDTSDFVIGRNPVGSAETNAYIDDLRVYHRKLSPTEITDLIPKICFAKVAKSSVTPVAATATAPLTAQANVAKSSATPIVATLSGTGNATCTAQTAKSAITPVAANSFNQPVYWKFDEGAGGTATDENNSLAITSTNPEWGVGKPGLDPESIKVSTFPLNTHWSISATTPALRPSTEFTISLWVKHHSVVNGSNAWLIGAKESSLDNPFAIRADGFGTGYFGVINVDGTEYTTSSSTTVASTGVWHFYVLRWKSGEVLTLDVYKEDGSSYSSVTTVASPSGNLTQADQDFRIGQGISTRTNAFIDDVRLFHTKLTDQQVQDLIPKICFASVAKAGAKPVASTLSGTGNATCTAQVAKSSAKPVASTLSGTGNATCTAQVAKSSVTPVASVGFNQPVYWKCDEGASNTITDENNSIVATATGTAKWVTGKAGLDPWAIHVSTATTGGYTTASNSKIEPSDALTVCCWVQVKDDPTAGAGLVRKWYSAFPSYNLGHSGTTKSLIAGVWGSDNLSITNTSTALNVDTWYFAVLRWQDGEGARLDIYTETGSSYFSHTSTTTAAGPIRYNTSLLYIGRDEAGDHVNDYIDDIRIYHRKLTDQQVQDLIPKICFAKVAQTSVTPVAASASVVTAAQAEVAKTAAKAVASTLAATGNATIVAAPSKSQSKAIATTLTATGNVAVNASVAKSGAKPAAATAVSSIIAQSSAAESQVKAVASVGFNQPVYWKCDEGASNTITDENNSIVATATGTAKWVTGKAGLDPWAIHVSTATSGQYPVNDAPALRPATEITLCFWYNAQSAPQTFARLIDKKNTGAGNYSYTVADNDADHKLVGAVRISGVNRSAQITTALSTNSWYFVVLRWKSGEIVDFDVFKEDGTLHENANTVTTYSGSITYDSPGSDPLYIGAHAAGLRINGYLDDIRIYHKKLTDQQVQDLIPKICFAKAAKTSAKAVAATLSATGSATATANVARSTATPISATLAGTGNVTVTSAVAKSVATPVAASATTSIFAYANPAKSVATPVAATLTATGSATATSAVASSVATPVVATLSGTGNATVTASAAKSAATPIASSALVSLVAYATVAKSVATPVAATLAGTGTATATAVVALSQATPIAASAVGTGSVTRTAPVAKSAATPIAATASASQFAYAAAAKSVATPVAASLAATGSATITAAPAKSVATPVAATALVEANTAFAAVAESVATPVAATISATGTATATAAVAKTAATPIAASAIGGAQATASPAKSGATPVVASLGGTGNATVTASVAESTATPIVATLAPTGSVSLIAEPAKSTATAVVPSAAGVGNATVTAPVAKAGAKAEIASAISGERALASVALSAVTPVAATFTASGMATATAPVAVSGATGVAASAIGSGNVTVTAAAAEAASTPVAASAAPTGSAVLAAAVAKSGTQGVSPTVSFSGTATIVAPVPKTGIKGVVPSISFGEATVQASVVSAASSQPAGYALVTEVQAPIVSANATVKPATIAFPQTISAPVLSVAATDVQARLIYDQTINASVQAATATVVDGQVQGQLVPTTYLVTTRSSGPFVAEGKGRSFRVLQRPEAA